MKKKAAFILKWGLFAFYYGCIFYLSSLEISQFSQFDLGSYDKAVHFLEFMGLGFLLMRACLWKNDIFLIPRRAWLTVLSLLFVFAFLDELHQSFVPSREPDILDGVADMGGGVCGMFLYVLMKRRLERLHRLKHRDT